MGDDGRIGTAGCARVTEDGAGDITSELLRIVEGAGERDRIPECAKIRYSCKP